MPQTGQFGTNRDHERKVVEDPSIAYTRKTRKKKTDTRKRMKSFYFWVPTCWHGTHHRSFLWTLWLSCHQEWPGRERCTSSPPAFWTAVVSKVRDKAQIIQESKDSRDKPNKVHFQCGHREALLQDSQYYQQSSWVDKREESNTSTEAESWWRLVYSL